MPSSPDRSGKTVRAGSAQLALGRLIKSGGAGSVYLLPQHPQSVAKLYHDHLPADAYRRKVEAMLALTPDLPPRVEGGKHHVQIAWPTALVHDFKGRFLGFLMPLLDIAATSELEPILQERQAMAAGLPTGLGAKMTLAANLAAVIASLHRQQHYVVDLKPVNVRFYRKSLYIALLDCDGFSIRGRSERFRAPQFTPDYLAPEGHNNGIAADGEHAQDLFALAVVIFQLVNFGIHPFTGKPASDRVPTDIPGRIRGGYYAYGRKPHPAIAPSPVSGHALIPDGLRDMFDRAFSGRVRPSAQDWADQLARYAHRDSGLLVNCSRNGAHQHFAELACAACARAQLLEQARQQAQHMAARRAKARPGGAPATPRRGVPQTHQGSLKGWWVLLAMGVLGWVLISRSCSPKPSRAELERANALAPSSAQFESRGRVRPVASTTMQATALPPIVPVAVRPDTRQMALRTLAVLNAMSTANVAVYSTSMEELSAFAQMSPRAQPASLQAYYAELTHRRENGEEAFGARDAAYQAIIEADPYAAFAVIELGTRRLLRGELADARALFTQAASTDPTNPKAWYGLGISYLADSETLAAAAIAVAELHFSDATEASEVSSLFELLIQNTPALRQSLPTVKSQARQRVAAMRRGLAQH